MLNDLGPRDGRLGGHDAFEAFISRRPFIVLEAKRSLCWKPLDYMVIVLFGDAAIVDPLTKKFLVIQGSGTRCKGPALVERLLIMTLDALRFGDMAPTWEASASIADAWFPELSGSIDARVVTVHGRALLRALALLVRVRFPDQASMKLVRQLIADEESTPSSVFDAIRQLGYSEATGAVEAATNVRGSWFCEPLKFLSINIAENCAEIVAARWHQMQLNGAAQTTALQVRPAGGGARFQPFQRNRELSQLYS